MGIEEMFEGVGYMKDVCGQSCKKYFRFDDDLGEMLVEGCELDLPIFNSKKIITCNSYTDRRSRL